MTRPTPRPGYFLLQSKPTPAGWIRRLLGLSPEPIRYVEVRKPVYHYDWTGECWVSGSLPRRSKAIQLGAVSIYHGRSIALYDAFKGLTERQNS